MTLDQARLALKLTRDPNPIRQALIKEMAGPRPPPKAGMQWDRALRALKTAGASLKPHSLPGKRRAKRCIERVEKNLRLQQSKALSAALPLLPSDPMHGAGSSGVFNCTVAPHRLRHKVTGFAEWTKLDCISNPAHRRAVRKLKTGQLTCATRIAQWSASADLSCGCGAEVQDPYRLVMECPLTNPARTAVLDRIRSHAVSDSLLSSLVYGQDAQSILCASLGAPLPGPWKRLSAGPYNTLVGLAGPMWAKGFSDLL